MADCEASILLNEDQEKNVKHMQIPKRKMSRLLKSVFAVISIGALFGVLALHFSWDKSSIYQKLIQTINSSRYKIGDMSFDPVENSINFFDAEKNIKYLAIFFPFTFKQKDSFCCDKNSFQNCQISNLCLNFSEATTASVSYKAEKMTDSHMKCYDIVFRTLNENVTMDVNMDSSGSKTKWYGLGGLSIQRYPLNRAMIPLQQFLTRKTVFDHEIPSSKFDSFLEPVLISSHGVAIMIKNSSSLFISVDGPNGVISFKSAKTSLKNNHNILNFKVCKSSNAKNILKQLLQSRNIQHSTVLPNKELLKKPIWSTRCVAQKIEREVLLTSYIKNITTRNLSSSMLIIDGNYSKSEGDYHFNHKKFPHSHQLIMELLNNKPKFPLLIGTEVFPKLNISSFLRTYITNNTSLYLDMSKSSFIDLYKTHLRYVQSQDNIGVSAFRFSGGQTFNIYADLNQSVSNNAYTTSYAKLAYDISSSSIISSGFQSQNYTFIADAGPLYSTWGHNKGLKGVIPTVLTYGLIGYPFVMAGPIGGCHIPDRQNSHQHPGSTKQDSIPLSVAGDLSQVHKTQEDTRDRSGTTELFIRWMQLSVYLPVMEFSFGPWVYGEEVVNHTRELLELRVNKLWPTYFEKAVEEALSKGTPIIRPLWWVAPDDPVAQSVDCEFMLGSLLVAPVLEAGVTARDIYLPVGGRWRGALDNQTHNGGQWLLDYPVGLYEVATFDLLPDD